jgi:ribosomal protein S18 acetylase RimI-like enzyme
MNVKNNGTIRAFTENDYQAVVDIHNATFPARLESVEAKRSADRERNPRSRRGRWVYEEDNRITAMAEYRQKMSGGGLEFQLQLEVHPECCGRGIGSKLYAWLEKALAPYEPRSFQVEVETEAGLNFMRERGFRETGSPVITARTLLEKPAPHKQAVASGEERPWST